MWYFVKYVIIFLTNSFSLQYLCAPVGEFKTF